MKKYECIRVCLGTDGTVAYWPLLKGADDLGPKPLDPEDALHLITGGGVSVELACADPQDDSVHHYESLFDEETNVKPRTSKSTFTLCKI